VGDLVCIALAARGGDHRAGGRRSRCEKGRRIEARRDGALVGAFSARWSHPSHPHPLIGTLIGALIGTFIGAASVK